MILYTRKNLFFLLLVVISLTCMTIQCLANEDVQYTNKLIVIYKTDETLGRALKLPVKIALPSFEALLDNVITKLINSGEISPDQIPTNNDSKNIRFQETNEEEIAYVETELERLDSYIVKVNDETVVETLKEALEQEPGVIRVTRDFEVFLTQSESNDINCTPDLKLPNDPYNIENWHFEKTGLLSAWNKTCICPGEIPEENCNVKEHPEFCNIGNPNIVNAVLDNGFSVGVQPGTTAHPDLANRWDVSVSKNVIIGDNPLDYDSSDETSSQVFYDHGTAVALSSSASSNNNTSHAGINWNSKVWAIRIGKGGGASLSNILAGFDYTISKVQSLNIPHFFVNLSYSSGDCNKSLSKTINDHCGQLIKSLGGLITISSGNSACFQNFEDVAPHVIVVGATQAANLCSNATVASYSSYGNLTDIFAPSRFVVDNRNTSVQNYALSKQTLNGTSFSAPSLAGFGTFLWSLNPSLTPDQLEKILKVSSFNTLSLFDLDTESKKRIRLSQSSQVQIDDAVNFQDQILRLIISSSPNSEKQDLFADTNNETTISATLLGSNETLKLEALDLPSGAAFDLISGTNTVSQRFLWTPPASEIGNSFKVTFLVKNASSKVYGYKKITFTVVKKPEAVNKPPLSNAGIDQTLNEGDLVTLDGSLSTDPDGDNISYFWTQIQNGTPIVTLSNPNTSKPTFTAPSVSSDTILSFQLKVTDPQGLESTDTVDIKVQNINRPPVINAGSDKTVRPRQVIRFTDATAVDPDGDILSYKWTIISSPIMVLRINPQSLNTGGLYVVSYDQGLSEVTFRLTVSDGTFTVSDDVVYTVRNYRPTSDAGADRNVIRTSFVRIGGINNTDPDGDTLRFSWTQIKGPRVTLSNPNIQYPIFRAPSTLTTPGNEIIFRLKVDDGFGSSSTDDISIFVTR